MTNELFETAPVPRAYFKTALPVVMGMVVSLVYNMVDTYFISLTGNTALVAGISLCAPIFTLMVALGDIFGIGGSSIISRLLGQKKEKDAAGISSFCYYAALICGVIVAVLMLLFRTPILTLLGATEETTYYASAYYRYLAIGAPFVILSLTPQNLLRTEGLSSKSMIGAAVGSVVNIILDPIFIFALGLGAAGAAIATVIGNVATNLYFLWVIRRDAKVLSVDPRLAKAGAYLGGIFAIGIPACTTNMMQSLGTALINRFLVPYGTDKVAAMGIALKANMIVLMVLIGFAFGAQALIGYNYGAGNQKRLKEIIRFDVMVELVFSCVVSLVMIVFARQIIAFFLDEAGVVEAGGLMLRCLLVTTPFVGIMLVCTTLFQSVGRAIPALLLSISRQGVVFIVCLAVLSTLFGYYGVLLSQAASDVLTAVLAVILLMRSGVLRTDAQTGS